MTPRTVIDHDLLVHEPHARATVDPSRSGERMLDDLCDQLCEEIAAAIADAAHAQAQLRGLRSSRPAGAAAPPPIHELDVAGDRCRSAVHHIVRATRTAAELHRQERMLDG